MIYSEVSLQISYFSRNWPTARLVEEALLKAPEISRQEDFLDISVYIYV